MRYALLILAAGLLAGGVLLAGDDYDDLYDPDEAARFRREAKGLTESILDNATTRPDEAATTQPDAPGPATQPDSPFASSPHQRRDRMPGYIQLSDGRVLPGRVYTTRDKPWSVYEESSKSFRRIPPTIVRGIDAVVLWERDQPEWRWKEGGSDEKIYTGRTYPARKVHYRFTLVNGMQITGTVQQPIYVAAGEGEPVRFILHERHKGAIGQSLGDLVYAKHVGLGSKAFEQGVELAKRQAATQPDEK